MADLKEMAPYESEMGEMYEYENDFCGRWRILAYDEGLDC
jgi:hypothetical protein